MNKCYVLDHEITLENFNRLTGEDLRLICPIIGQRIRLEDEMKLIKPRKFYSANEAQHYPAELKVS